LWVVEAHSPLGNEPQAPDETDLFPGDYEAVYIDPQVFLTKQMDDIASLTPKAAFQTIQQKVEHDCAPHGQEWLRTFAPHANERAALYHPQKAQHVYWALRQEAVNRTISTDTRRPETITPGWGNNHASAPEAIEGLARGSEPDAGEKRALVRLQTDPRRQSR